MRRALPDGVSAVDVLVLLGDVSTAAVGGVAAVSIAPGVAGGDDTLDGDSGGAVPSARGTSSSADTPVACDDVCQHEVATNGALPFAQAQ
jgi:hypothetical protein